MCSASGWSNATVHETRSRLPFRKAVASWHSVYYLVSSESVKEPRQIWFLLTFSFGVLTLFSTTSSHMILYICRTQVRYETQSPLPCRKSGVMADQACGSRLQPASSVPPSPAGGRQARGGRFAAGVMHEMRHGSGRLGSPSNPLTCATAAVRLARGSPAPSLLAQGFTKYGFHKKPTGSLGGGGALPARTRQLRFAPGSD